MKIHRIEKIPEGWRGEYTSCEFDSWDLKEIPDSIVEMWYWYATGCYCGAGHIIMKSCDDLWYHHDCGHCSCYGPICHLRLEKGSSLEDLLGRCTEELLKELKPLTDVILEK